MVACTLAVGLTVPQKAFADQVDDCVSNPDNTVAMTCCRDQVKGLCMQYRCVRIITTRMSSERDASAMVVGLDAQAKWHGCRADGSRVAAPPRPVVSAIPGPQGEPGPAGPAGPAYDDSALKARLDAAERAILDRPTKLEVAAAMDSGSGKGGKGGSGSGSGAYYPDHLYLGVEFQYRTFAVGKAVMQVAGAGFYLEKRAFAMNVSLNSGSDPNYKPYKAVILTSARLEYLPWSFLGFTAEGFWGRTGAAVNAGWERQFAGGNLGIDFRLLAWPGVPRFWQRFLSLTGGGGLAGVWGNSDHWQWTTAGNWFAGLTSRLAW